MKSKTRARREEHPDNFVPVGNTEAQKLLLQWQAQDAEKRVSQSLSKLKEGKPKGNTNG